jgi:hypothetical protein
MDALTPVRGDGKGDLCWYPRPSGAGHCGAADRGAGLAANTAGAAISIESWIELDGMEAVRPAESGPYTLTVCGWRPVCGGSGRGVAPFWAPWRSVALALLGGWE